MKYPQSKSRANSCRSCGSHSVNTLVTSVSEARESCVEARRGEEQVEGLRLLGERDMRSLHKHIPALGRRDVQLSGIRHHYYPEGGWGWVVVACSALAQTLTTGLLLAGGVLSLEMSAHFPPTSNLVTSLVTATAWSTSLGVSPIVTHLCRQSSVRLAAVVGGLVMNLAFLFASFGHQLHQVLLSYGLLFPLGCSAVRDASSLMVGQYFKARREVAETVVLGGPGLGLLIFSLLYKRSIGSLGWRLGLQALHALTILAFFLGLFLRSASLYHPQRDAISHIKYQKEKVKPVNSKEKQKKKREKSELLDFSFARNRTVRVLLASSALGAVGMYTPLFCLSHQLAQEEKDVEEGSLLLLHIWLGVATTVGCLLAGLITTSTSSEYFISRYFLSFLFRMRNSKKKIEKRINRKLLLQLSHYMGAIAMFCFYCVAGRNC